MVRCYKQKRQKWEIEHSHKLSRKKVCRYWKAWPIASFLVFVWFVRNKNVGLNSRWWLLMTVDVWEMQHLLLYYDFSQRQGQRGNCNQCKGPSIHIFWFLLSTLDVQLLDLVPWPLHTLGPGMSICRKCSHHWHLNPTASERRTSCWVSESRDCCFLRWLAVWLWRHFLGFALGLRMFVVFEERTH